MLEETLKTLGIQEDDILKRAKADMNIDCEYQEHELILTKDTLTVVTYEKRNNTRIFAGFPMSGIIATGDGEKLTRKQRKSNKAAAKIAAVEPPIVKNIEQFSVKDIKSPVINDMVAGGILVADIKLDGDEFIPRALCATTNLHKGECAKLIATLEKLVKNEDLPEKEEEIERFCPKCGTIYPEEGREVCNHCLNRGTVFKRTLAHFMPYKKRFIPMFICIGLAAVLGVLWPFLSGTVLYDQVLSRGVLAREEGREIARYFTMLTILVLGMIAVRLVQQTLAIIQMRIIAKIVPYVVRSIREQTFAALEKLPISFFAKRQTGGLMTRVLEDSETISGFFIDGLPGAFVHGFTLIAASVIMAIIHWQLALVTIFIMPIMLFIHFWLGPKFWNMVGRRHRARRRMVAQINDNITGARVVKAFGQQDKETARFGKVNQTVQDSEMSLVKVDSLYTALYFACHTLIQLVVWAIGSWIILGGTPNFSFGILLTFVNYTAMLQWPIEFFSFVVRWWAQSMNSASRIFEIIDHHPDVVEPLNPTPLPDMKGHIKLDKVSFGYNPYQNVLKGIDLEIPAGNMLGVVGKSGAGKSTLVNLISRLYDVGEGAITIDGVNVRDLSFADLRTQVAMVSQETYIFMGTIAENIAYGCPDISRDDIVKAAQAASAHDFIVKCPDGYDTLVGSGHRDLSGGERQRVSIARAILMNPRILILDEATAAMDTETEWKIQAALDKLIVGRTTISIAHRLSTLRNADSLIVIDDGKIVEEGTHLELIRKKGEYFKLVQIQAKALSMRAPEKPKDDDDDN